MSHHPRMTFGKASADEPTKRVVTGELPPPERTPAEMLAVLHRIVNRQVEQLDAVTKGGRLLLEGSYDDMLDLVLERVCKLAREERSREPTDTELLEEHDRGQAR